MIFIKNSIKNELSVSIQFDISYDDIGMYKCEAKTRHHISTSICDLVITKFDVIVSPSTLEIEIGNEAVFTCEISALVPEWLQPSFTFKWSRGDNVDISTNAIGINSPTLRIVSFYVPYVTLSFLIEINKFIIFLSSWMQKFLWYSFR